MDLRLRAETPMDVHLPGAGIDLHLASGEEIRMEISTKFTADASARSWARSPSTWSRTWTDAGGDFAVTLARREA